MVSGSYPAKILVTSGRHSKEIFVVLNVKSDAAGTLLPACTGNAGVPPIVRPTGPTEQFADLVLNCDPIATGVTSDVRITLNTVITSRSNDLLLLINEPAPFDQALGVNVFRGVRVGETQVIFPNVTLPLSQSANILRITNLQADASRLGISNTQIPTQARARIYLSTLPLRGPDQTLAFIQPGHTFTVLDSAGTAAPNLTAAGNGKLRFREDFANSFKRRNRGTTFATPNNLLSQNAPGAIYNTETGFYNPALPPGAAPDMGLATQGTRLVARFSNIPAGITISVSVNELGAASPKAQLVQADANGAGAFQAITGPYALRAGRHR